MANDGKDTVTKILVVVFGCAVTLLMAAFGSLESRKMDKSAFEVKAKADDQRLERIESSVDKIDTKIDQLLKQEHAK